MAVRIATFTVRVKYDTNTILNPGHLIGGMTDEILGWNKNETHYSVEVTDAHFEDEVEAARREALFLVGVHLDAMAKDNHPTAMVQGVFEAVRIWVELEGRTDVFGAYVELQGEALALGHGQK